MNKCRFVLFLQDIILEKGIAESNQARQGKGLNKFKSIMMGLHGEPKEKLRWLYVDKQVYNSSVRSSEQYVEEERIYHYRELSFWFTGTGFRTPEKLVMFVAVPEELLGFTGNLRHAGTAVEDYLLKSISGNVNELSQSWQNDHKSSREKPQFAMQTVTGVVLKRNGCRYDETRRAFAVRISCSIPLINGGGINAKSGIKGVRDVLECIQVWLENYNQEELEEQIRLYIRQLEIRQYLQEHNLIAFVADGSILPRCGGEDLAAKGEDGPFKGAVPFQSPDRLRAEISFSDGGSVSGMGIPRGITVITGGGYSGKSTLLDSLEMGIYFHRGGDGREYVITDPTAVKIYAEDGRPVKEMDISPFFSHLPGERNIYCFSTNRASGSVSQGTNIIEAVYGGSSLLLVDEDTSATNFMIRDEMMRQLVKNEPIIPFTDRIFELKEKGISTILVIGGSGEYLYYADTVLLMQDYRVYDRTEQVKQWLSGKRSMPEVKYDYQWTKECFFKQERKQDGFFYSTLVQIENARYIRISGIREYVSDITKLTAVFGQGQISALSFLMERLLMEEEKDSEDLMERCRNLTEGLFPTAQETILSNSHKYELWLEEIRPLDLYFAVSRMRG